MQAHLRLHAEEINAIGRIEILAPFGETVEEAQPEERQRQRRRDLIAEAERAQEVAIGPQEGDASTADGAGLDLAEAAEQPAMGAGAEALEVVSTRVHLLHERRVGIDETVVLEHAVQFADHHFRLENMFEHRLNPDGVEAPVLEGQVMRIGDERRHSGWENIG